MQSMSSALCAVASTRACRPLGKEMRIQYAFVFLSLPSAYRSVTQTGRFSPSAFTIRIDTPERVAPVSQIAVAASEGCPLREDRLTCVRIQECGCMHSAEAISEHCLFFFIFPCYCAQPHDSQVLDRLHNLFHVSLILSVLRCKVTNYFTQKTPKAQKKTQ